MTTPRGVESFINCYSKLYGSRWESLSAGLSSPVEHVARLNPFSSAQMEFESGLVLSSIFNGAKLSHCTEPSLGGCFRLDTSSPSISSNQSGGYTLPTIESLSQGVEQSLKVNEKEQAKEDLLEDELMDTRLPEPTRDTNGIMKYYLMDAASVVAARALDVKPWHHVLDLCASPGGKSLILASALFGTHSPNYDRNEKKQDDQSNTNETPSDSKKVSKEKEKEKEKSKNKSKHDDDDDSDEEESEESEEEDDVSHRQRGMLVCNELNNSRRAKLRKVLKDYLPSTVLKRVTVTGVDGEKWGQSETRLFDRILVDAPCSSERHLIHNPKEMVDWNRNKTKKNSERQYNLMMNAIKSCKKGGRIVYGTCSLSPLENEELISKVLETKSKSVKVHPFSCELGEPLKYGWVMLPDKCKYGPIYLCVLERI